MKIISRYVFSELLQVFLVALSALTLFMLVFGLLKEAQQQGLGMMQIAALVPYVLPEAMRFAVPGTMLFAVASVFGRMSATNEITALKAEAFRAGILIMPGNNLGYFGRGEAHLRSPSAHGADHWLGCQAGRYVMGIESDGGVKGCPSLQSDAYIGGHLRDRSLAEIWNDSPRLAFARARTVDDLWGFCATCPFAAVCLGGCSFTAHSLFGRPGNNPFCVFRAEALRQAGQRERLVRVAPAPGRPFDHALFEIVLEAFDAPDPGRDLSVTERMRPRRVNG
jgi:radical SAM protein with 4Fe4S-binding SPASM domain